MRRTMSDSTGAGPPFPTQAETSGCPTLPAYFAGGWEMSCWSHAVSHRTRDKDGARGAATRKAPLVLGMAARISRRFLVVERLLDSREEISFVVMGNP